MRDVGPLLRVGADLAEILVQRIEVPVEVPRCHFQAAFTQNTHLTQNLARIAVIADFGGVHPRPDVAALCVLLQPPVIVGDEAELGPVNRPVELRREVIDPALLQPLLRVRAQILIWIESAARTFGMIRPPQAKRADAELHMPLDRLDALVGGLHGLVHVLPAPCRELQRAARGLVARISVAVGKLDLLFR